MARTPRRRGRRATMEEKSDGVLPTANSRSRNTLSCGFNGIGRSKTSIRSKPLREISDGTKIRKKVRFSDINAAHAFSWKIDDSSRTCRTDDPNYVPKTAELSSYKKLLEEAGCNLHSRQQRKEAIKPKNADVRNTTKVIKDTVTGTSNLSKPLLVADLTPLVQPKFPSPIVVLEDRAEKCSSKCLFSDKRHNIITAAADSLSLEVSDFASMGLDLIPQFLQRLGIENRSSNHDKVPISFQKHGHDLSYLQGQSCSIPHILSGDNAPTVSIFQGQRMLPDHVYDANHCLTPLQQEYREDEGYQDTPEKLLNADCFRDNGTMELVTSMKCDIDIASSENSLFNIYPATDTFVSKFEFFSREDSFSKFPRLKVSLVPRESSSHSNELDRALVPYNYSRPWDFNELYSSDEPARFMRDKCTHLLEWEEKAITSGTPTGLDIFSEDENHMALTLYHDPVALGFDCHPVQCFDSKNIIDSLANCFRMFPEETNSRLDDALLPSCSNSFSGFTDLSMDSLGGQCLLTYPDLQAREIVGGRRTFSSSYSGEEFVRYITDEDEFQTLLPD